MKATEEDLFKQAMTKAIQWYIDYNRVPRECYIGEYQRKKEKQFKWLYENFKAMMQYKDRPITKEEALMQALEDASNWERFATEEELHSMTALEAKNAVVDRIKEKLEKRLWDKEENQDIPKFYLRISGQDTKNGLLYALERIQIDLKDYCFNGNGITCCYGRLKLEIKKILL